MSVMWEVVVVVVVVVVVGEGGWEAGTPPQRQKKNTHPPKSYLTKLASANLTKSNSSNRQLGLAPPS